MKIVIVTGYYPPFKTPRAYRAAELAREFSKRGHDVKVFTTRSMIDENGNNIIDDDYKDINVEYLGIIEVVKKHKMLSEIKKTTIKNVLKKILFYFTTNIGLKEYLGIKKKFILSEGYDLLISIAHPFAVHWGVASKLKHDKMIRCCVADYGDPFSKYNLTLQVAPYFQYIEKRVIDKFDYISVPDEKAVSSYQWLKPNNRIKIIPQGFDFSEVKVFEYKKNSKPTFAFAGNFYEGIRNPQSFFLHLTKVKFDFRFIVYINKTNEGYKCIEPYIEILNEKIIVKEFLPRIELISELSKMDFIINVDNISSNQVPSKLIDYALSKRPILSFNQYNFDEKKFEEFCKGDYSSQLRIDLNKYKISNIADSFENLLQDVL